MSTISKLRIQGVRSYSHLKPGTIEFHKPLTIIVGANGSGKTTIIESLKFATTGEQPPLSDKGKSFVHDPKVQGINLVKGKVMLGFRTADEKTFVATRAFQLAQKTKTKREYKLIDSVLRTKNALGEEKALSHRCAEMDKQVPLLLGVSKAVLENVIFCHQEDSNWPLSDPRNLKKKFDDIFAATRWTQAQDNIYKIRKKKAAAVKQMESNLRVLESNLETAKRIESEVRKLEADIARRREERSKLEEKRDEQREKLERLRGASEELRGMRNEVQARRRHLRILADEAKAARELVDDEINDDPTDKLKMAQQALQRAVERSVAAAATIARQIRALGTDRQRAERKLREITADIGRANALQEQYNSDRKRCVEITQRCCDQYGFSSVEREGAPMDVPEFELVCSKLRERAQEAQTKIDAHKREAKRADSDHEARISNISRKIGSLRDKTEMHRRRRREIDARSAYIAAERRRIRGQLDDEGGADEDKGSIDSQIKAAEAKLESARGRGDVARVEAEIADVMRRLDAGVSELSVLKLQQQEYAVQSDARNRLKYRVRERAALQREFETKIASHRAELTKLGLDASLPSPGSPGAGGRLERRHRTQLDDAEAELKKAARELQAAENEVSRHEGELASTRQGLERVQAGIARDTQAFDQHGVGTALRGGKGLPERISEVEAKVTRAKESIELWEPMRKVYDMFRKQAAKNVSAHVCPLCRRGMDGAELKTFNESIEKKITSLAAGAARQQFTDRVRKYQRELDALRSLSGAWVRLKDLREQKTRGNKRVQEIERTLTTLHASVDACTSAHRKRAERRRELAELTPIVAAVVRLCAKAADEDRAIAEEQERLEAEGGPSEEAYARVQADAKRLEAENLEMHKQLGELRKGQSESQAEIRALEAEFNRLRERRARNQRLHLTLENLGKEDAALRAENAKVTAAADACARELEPLAGNLKSERVSRRQSHDRYARAERVMLESRQKVTRQLDTLSGKIASLKRLGSREATARRERLFAEKQKLSTELETATHALRQAEIKRAAVEREERQKREVERNITLVLEYRERVAKLDRARADVAKLEQQLESKGGARLSESIETARDRAQALQSKVDLIAGRISAQAEQIRVHRKELSTPRLRGVAAEHRQATIECETWKLAIEDLENYSKALEKALMEFHSAKMAEINESLRDYWQTTYSGHDIEEIQIRSNHTQELKGRRQYNYHVVMKQKDTELSMRGRCSAGQKVLASLLIRLALADTFCTRCGVLALDEPTTNLDRANIGQFARALNGIISKRAEQENFQLIIITHDEEFVDMLGTSDHCDYYYRVYKDEEQCSRIKQQPFHSL